MFTEAVKDDDFIVIVGEQNNITNMIKEYLKVECSERGKNWEGIKKIDLDENEANQFLLKLHRILKLTEKENVKRTKKPDYINKHKNSNAQTKQKLKNARKPSTNVTERS